MSTKTYDKMLFQFQFFFFYFIKLQPVIRWTEQHIVNLLLLFSRNCGLLAILEDSGYNNYQLGTPVLIDTVNILGVVESVALALVSYNVSHSNTIPTFPLGKNSCGICYL